MGLGLLPLGLGGEYHIEGELMGCDALTFHQAPVELEGKNFYKYVSTKDTRLKTNHKQMACDFFFFPFVHSLSPEFSAPLTCSERLAPWSSCPLCGGDSTPLTDKVLFSMFRKPQGNVLSHFTVFSISACLAGKRSNLC